MLYQFVSQYIWLIFVVIVSAVFQGKRFRRMAQSKAETRFGRTERRKTKGGVELTMSPSTKFNYSRKSSRNMQNDARNCLHNKFRRDYFTFSPAFTCLFVVDVVNKEFILLHHFRSKDNNPQQYLQRKAGEAV